MTPDPCDFTGRVVGGRYPLQYVIGRGSMGTVYASSLELARSPCAVKISRSGDDIIRTFFQREYQALSRLTHSNIVAFRDVGDDKEIGRHFLVTEYVQGCDLQSLLRHGGGIPARDAVALVAQACAGLQYAHDHGVIHRDVKPDNLRVEEGGRVKVMDFGLAYITDWSLPNPTFPNAIGSPRYRCPEQSKCDPRPDPHWDVFAAAKTLYHLITNSPPDWPEWPDHPRIEWSAIPDRLRPVIERATAESAAARYPSAKEFAAAAVAAVFEGDPPQVSRDFLARIEAHIRNGTDPLVSSSAAPAVASSATSSSPGRVRPWMGLAACVVLAPFVALTAANCDRSPAPVGGGPPTNPSTDKGPPASPLRVAKFAGQHSPRVGLRSGLLGRESFRPAWRPNEQHDQITLAASLSRPGYAYLLAYRADGKVELCYPEAEDEPPPLTEVVCYPSRAESRALRYGLGEGPGLWVFAVAASDAPLPAYRDWAKDWAATWTTHKGDPGVVYWDDGQFLEALTPGGPRRGERGKGEENGDAAAAVVGVTNSLRKRPRVDTAGALGFTVERGE